MGGLIVVDASAAVEAALPASHAEEVWELLRAHGPAFVPAHFEAEAWGAIARLHRRGVIHPAGAYESARTIADFPATRVALAPLLKLVPAWLGVVAGPDAFYAVLAAGARAPLLTCDLGLARALDGRVRVLYVEPTVF